MSMSNISVHKDKPLSIKYVLFLMLSVAVYSMSGLFTKLASRFDFFSPSYIGCLLGALFILATYAILWQIILKKVQLSQAYPFRSLGVIYGLAIASFAFHEPISFQNIMGCGLIMGGLLTLSVGVEK